MNDTSDGNSGSGSGGGGGDNKKIKVWVELCGGADGIIYKEFSAEGRFEELKPQITAFVYECYNHYNKLIKEYIAFPITSN